MAAPVAAIQDLSAERDRLERTWAVPGGVIGWLRAADHKTIGKRFIATAFAFFLLGGILAVLMRVQLAWPENTFLDPDLYNQLFSLHGTTMMFLFAVPVTPTAGASSTSARTRSIGTSSCWCGCRSMPSSTGCPGWAEEVGMKEEFAPSPWTVTGGTTWAGVLGGPLPGSRASR